ncbi:MAG: hypothetical protein E6K32_00125 [Gammaproteobacteria bacterium]|nr:MAG: hypothetical protein E6K32_00125 [Gammaproteobacteria bacterium]
MRFAATVLACLGAGAVTVALADPSSPAPQQPAAASSSSATAPPAAAPAPPATTPSSATQTPAPAKPAVDPEEKRLLAQGYRAKMRHGEKIFCRTEPELGSRLGGKEICGTVADLKAQQASTREEIQREQRISVPPPGK